MRVSGILASKGSSVATLSADDSGADAVRQLRTHGIGSLVVTADGRRIIGIVSERDIVRQLAEGCDVLTKPVSELMSTGVRTCAPDDSVEELMRVMTELRTRHLPVEEDGQLIGIISIGDVVKSRVNELEDERRHLHDYITAGR